MFNWNNNGEYDMQNRMIDITFIISILLLCASDFIVGSRIIENVYSIVG